jgi:hypothetical protein
MDTESRSREETVETGRRGDRVEEIPGERGTGKCRKGIKLEVYEGEAG